MMMLPSSPVDRHAARVALFTGLGASALILGALGFQYIGGLSACHMCHWQRWPHIAAALIGIGGGTLAAKDDHQHALAWLALFLVLVSGLIGAYQQGMQFGLLPGPNSCTSALYVLGSNAPPPERCDVPSWTLLGISLAGYNAIISFLIAGIGGVLLWKGPRRA